MQLTIINKKPLFKYSLETKFLMNLYDIEPGYYNIIVDVNNFYFYNNKIYKRFNSKYECDEYCDIINKSLKNV